MQEIEFEDDYEGLSGNDILTIEFYSPNRIEYSVNLSELIISK
jgi:hypothetical protein